VADSIGKPKLCKPPKPYKDFPLYPHNSKRWAKKIRQRTHFFGPWDNWEAALERYQYEKDYLQQGKTPPARTASDALNVDCLVNGYLEHQDRRVLTGELTKRSWNDLKRVGELLIKHLGRHTTIESLRPTDFDTLRTKLAAGKTLVTLNNEVGRCRCFFNYAFKAELIDRPVRMGVSFSKPTKKALRKEKQSKPPKLFSIDELKAIYGAANAQMQCFILLGLNGGLGPADIGNLEFRHIQGDWIIYPRPKSTIDRRFPIWAETKKAIEACKQTKDSQLPWVFLTKYGQPWSKSTSDTPLSNEFGKLLQSIDDQAVEAALEQRKKPPTHKLKQKGRGFYTLRHQFRTIADGCRDQVAINHIMGHADSTMAGVYREHIDDSRLQAVVDHVRAWAKPIFAKKRGAK
jgi:integrase